MQKFTLPAARVNELTVVIDSIPLKECGTLKDVRITNNLVKDLVEILKSKATAFLNAQVSLTTKQNDLAVTYKKKFEEESEKMTKEDAEQFGKRIDAEFQKEAAKQFKAEFDELNEEGKKEIEVELEDEKMAKLKELFSKFALAKYNNKEIFLMVNDALEIKE